MYRFGYNFLKWYSRLPGLLSRMQLFGSTPAIEIEGELWRHTVGKEVSVDEFICLLEHISQRKRAAL